MHTVCQSAQCPNLGECWSRGTATVMILGNICTRSCNFCAIQTGRPTELDLGEPARVADAVARMGLRHVVVTSVARDELADGGAGVWAATIRAVRHRNPQTAIEVLVPDFKGRLTDVDTVLDARPDIFNHNVETVERLQKPVRVQARYDRSRERPAPRQDPADSPPRPASCSASANARRRSSRPCATSSATACEILTIGQYLQPTRAAPARGALGHARGVPALEGRSACRSDSASSRAARWCARAITPTSSREVHRRGAPELGERARERVSCSFPERGPRPRLRPALRTSRPRSSLQTGARPLPAD